MGLAVRLNLSTALLSLVLPGVALADLSQTTTLSTSGSTNLNLDTGASGSTGGDIEFSAAGIAPVGSAKLVNRGGETAAQFAADTLLLVELWPPGYSTTPIPAATLAPSTPFQDAFYVHTNGGHYAKLLVTAISASSITLNIVTFGVTGGGTSGPPVVTAVRNNSSGIPYGAPNYGIAPSSIFVVTGTGLADAGTPVLQDSSKAGGIPITLNGASVAVTVNGVTVHPGLYYTSPTQLAGVLPASTPVGSGTLTVTYNNVASNAEPIVVVPSALGINTFYTNSAVATDASTYALLTWTNSGTPGENIVLWTTGLGADAADSDTSYTSTPHAVATALQIYIGGALAPILYQGSAGYPGVNQINVTIPASTPNGCWISMAAVSNGVLSNIATIPVNAGGGACVDPVSGLTGTAIMPSGSQDLRTGVVVITQTSSTNAKGVTTFSSAATAAFEEYTGIYTPTNQVSPGGCIESVRTTVSPGPFTGLDPGQITLSGPNLPSVTVPNQLGIKGAFALSLTAGAVPQTGGTFVFNGAGGADVGSFTSTLTFTNPILSWTNANIGGSIDRSKDLTVNWTGGNPNSYIFVTGTSTASSNGVQTRAGFTCLGKAGDGQLTVPSYILSALPAGSGGVEIQNDFYLKLSPSGIGIGLAVGEIGMGVASTYK